MGWHETMSAGDVTFLRGLQRETAKGWEGALASLLFPLLDSSARPLDRVVRYPL